MSRSYSIVDDDSIGPTDEELDNIDEYEEDDYDYDGAEDRHLEILERLDRIEEMIESLPRV